MSVLVTGSDGLLGSNLVTIATQQGYDVIGTYHSSPPSDVEAKVVQLDITDVDKFKELMTEHDLSAVINCAAMTDVDQCEVKPDIARRINGEAPKRLASVCEEYGVKFCQISTDYVFSDPEVHPIPEGAETDPIQVYGETKRQGERGVQRNHSDPLIARISFVYGINQFEDALVGLPKWILSRLREREPVPLYTDQQISPTQAKHAGETILTLLLADAGGIYHCSNAGCVTPYGFGEFLARLANWGDPSLLTASSLRNRDTTAERPMRVCLSVEKTEHFLDRPQPSWKDGLRVVADYLK